MQQQATGRIAGQAGPSIYHAAGALLVAMALVVGLTLAAQRLSIGGPVAAPAPNAADIQKAQNDFLAGERDVYVPATKPDVIMPPYLWDESTHCFVPNKAYPAPRPLTRGSEWDQAHHRFVEVVPQTLSDKPDGVRRTGYEIR